MDVQFLFPNSGPGFVVAFNPIFPLLALFLGVAQKVTEEWTSTSISLFFQIQSSGSPFNLTIF